MACYAVAPDAAVVVAEAKAKAFGPTLDCCVTVGDRVDDMMDDVMMMDCIEFAFAVMEARRAMGMDLTVVLRKTRAGGN